MDYKLKATDGKVTFLLAAGKDFCENEMPLSTAEKIVVTGTITTSDIAGYPICVNNRWYFKGTPVRPARSKARKNPKEG